MKRRGIVLAAGLAMALAVAGCTAGNGGGGGTPQEEGKPDKLTMLVMDSPSADGLKALAEKHGIKNTILTITREPTGPKAYKIARAADVTVILYARHRVIVNHAFKKGELNAKAIDVIVTDVSKILPAK